METLKMVVKYVNNNYPCYNSTQFTLGKYYPVLRIDSNSYRIIGDYNCDEGYLNESEVILFKVGDRFNWECNNIIYVITEFKNINDLLTINLKEEESQEPWLNWKIEAFDKAFTKIEEKLELLPIGTRVKIIAPGAFYKDEGIILGLESIYYKLAVVGCSPILILQHQVEKPEDSKSEWQPKFKVGDWVTAKQNDCVLRKIKSIDHKNKNYVTEFIDGSGSINKHYDNDLKLWQPMQELKDELAFHKEVIKNLTNLLNSRSGFRG